MKWEYMVEKIPGVTSGSFIPHLNSRGSNGWEYVERREISTGGNTEWWGIFKREVIE